MAHAIQGATVAAQREFEASCPARQVSGGVRKASGFAWPIQVGIDWHDEPIDGSTGGRVSSTSWNARGTRSTTRNTRTPTSTISP